MSSWLASAKLRTRTRGYEAQEVQESLKATAKCDSSFSNALQLFKCTFNSTDVR